MTAPPPAPPPTRNLKSASKKRKFSPVDASVYVRRSTRNLGKEQPDYREDALAAVAAVHLPGAIDELVRSERVLVRSQPVS